jgi:hypothetical protein
MSNCIENENENENRRATSFHEHLNALRSTASIKEEKK